MPDAEMGYRYLLLLLQVPGRWDRVKTGKEFINVTRAGPRAIHGRTFFGSPKET